MRNKSTPLFAALCIAFPAVACADSTSDSLTRIEAETLLLKAREKQLAVQAQIVAKQTEIASRQAENYRLARTASAGDPVIRSVEGIGRNMVATLQLDNGSTVDARVGDVLPNGMRVASVSVNEVIVETQKNKRIRLSTGSAAAASYAAGNPSVSMALPPLPPMPPAVSGGVR